MRLIIVFIYISTLMTSAFCAEELEHSSAKNISDSSVIKKEDLKNYPRLGMTLNQLENLWGSFDYKSKDERIWRNIGGLEMKVKFLPVYKDEFNVDPNKTRCVSIVFSRLDNHVALTPDEAIKIAEKLLPGFNFILPEKHLVFEGLTCFSTDKGKTYELKGTGEFGCYILEFNESNAAELDLSEL